MITNNFAQREVSTGPSDSRHASTRAGTLQLSCNVIIMVLIT